MDLLDINVKIFYDLEILEKVRDLTQFSISFFFFLEKKFKEEFILIFSSFGQNALCNKMD